MILVPASSRSLVQATIPLDPQTGIRTRYEAPEHPLGTLEETGAIQQWVPYPYGKAVVGVVGTLVVDVVVLIGENNTPSLDLGREGWRSVRVRPLVTQVR